MFKTGHRYRIPACCTSYLDSARKVGCQTSRGRCAVRSARLKSRFFLTADYHWLPARLAAYQEISADH